MERENTFIGKGVKHVEKQKLQIEVPEYNEESSLDDGNGGNGQMLYNCDKGSVPASRRHKRSRSETLKEVCH